MATEDFCSTLWPLLSPRWSQLCLTPSPPRPFLPSSNSNYSMVMQYQGSNQSMDNPLQNQQWHEEDMDDSALYLAGDSALLQQQQQLRLNGSKASDWRPRGGIMKMNNQGFEESNMGFEEESEEMMMNCISFPPSPTDFTLYLPRPSSSISIIFSVFSEVSNWFEQNARMVLSDDQPIFEVNSIALDWMNKMEQDILPRFKDKSGVLDAINNGLEQKHEGIFYWPFQGIFSYIENNVNDLDRIIGAEGMMPEDVVLLVQNIWQEDMDEMEVFTLRKINWFEQHDVDIVDQPVLEMVGLVQQLLQNKGGELDLIPGGGVCTINGLEHSDGQGLPMTTERSLIFQTKFAVRVWLGYGGRWVAEIRWRQRLVDATFALEMVMRWSGWMDLTGFPGLFQKENRSKLPLQLPLPAQEEKPDEDFGLVRCNARGNDEIEAVGTGSEGTWNCVMAHQARLNLGKRKTKEKNPGGERRNKKTNGVRIAIPLEDILQTKGMRLKDAANHLEVSRSTLKRVCRKYGILSWPPSKGNEHICQSRPKETPTVVDQEGVQQLNCEILPCEILPSDRALAANVDTNSVVLKARWVDDIIVKIRLPKPWKMAELEQQVKKRLKLESGTYYIRYKDEESELITILCDEDLQEYISSSRPLDTSSIEVFLVPK